MGCTYSKHSKSKSSSNQSNRTNNDAEKPVLRGDNLEKTQNNTLLISNNANYPSSEDQSKSRKKPTTYSRQILSREKHEQDQQQPKKQIAEPTLSPPRNPLSVDPEIQETKNLRNEIPCQNTVATSTAVLPVPSKIQQVESMYYPMPTVGTDKGQPNNKQEKAQIKSPQKKDPSKKRKLDVTREKQSQILGPSRPQLTQEDLEYIRRSVEQRNERRAYMATHRNETDDTLYELETRMPEKDYTNNSRVF